MDRNRLRTPAGAAFAWTALVFVAALLVRLAGAADAPLHTDEMYTVLAARGYAEDGVPRIWHGQYLRAVGFTALVAGALNVFGDHLLAARLPAIVASALWVAVGFAWLRREAGLLAGLALALLLGLSSLAIGSAQFARFYALHALLFWIAALAVYYASEPRLGGHADPGGVQQQRRRRVVAWIVAGVAAAAAWHLQAMTAIGLAGLAVWVVLVEGWRLWSAPATSFRRLVLAGWLLAPVVVAAVVWIMWPDIVQSWWRQYRWSTLWAAAHQNDSLYYLRQLARALPVLFYLFPLAALVALARAPRPALFALTVAAVALLLHSFAGMKDMRYVQYLWPLLLTPIAIAGADAIARLYFAAIDAQRSLFGSASRTAAVGLLAVALAVLLIGNRDYSTLRQLPGLVAADLGIGKVGEARRLQRAAAGEALIVLRQLTADRYIVTSNELLTLWHLGRYDVLLHSGRLHELAEGREFVRDPRTGGAVISAAQSLRQLLPCGPATALLVWHGDWRRPEAVTDAAADVIEAMLHEVALPSGLGVRAFVWRPDAVVPAGHCPLKREPPPGRLAAQWGTR